MRCSVEENENEMNDCRDSEYGREGVPGCSRGRVGVEFDPGVRPICSVVENEVHILYLRSVSKL